MQRWRIRVCDWFRKSGGGGGGSGWAKGEGAGWLVVLDAMAL